MKTESELNPENGKSPKTIYKDTRIRTNILNFSQKVDSAGRMVVNPKIHGPVEVGPEIMSMDSIPTTNLITYLEQENLVINKPTTTNTSEISTENLIEFDLIRKRKNSTERQLKPKKLNKVLIINNINKKTKSSSKEIKSDENLTKKPNITTKIHASIIKIDKMATKVDTKVVDKTKLAINQPKDPETQAIQTKPRVKETKKLSNKKRKAEEELERNKKLWNAFSIQKK